MIQIAALRSRLEKQPTDLRRSPRDLGDGALARAASVTGKYTIDAATVSFTVIEAVSITI
jgi:hypothetical protein